jgi:hypothetical protein
MGIRVARFTNEQVIEASRQVFLAIRSLAASSPLRADAEGPGVRLHHAASGGRLGQSNRFPRALNYP